MLKDFLNCANVFGFLARIVTERLPLRLCSLDIGPTYTMATAVAQYS